MDQCRHDEASERAAGKCFCHHQGTQRVSLRATVFDGIGDTEKSQLAHLAQDFPWYASLLLPSRTIGLYFLFDEARDLVAQRDMLFVQIDGFHGLEYRHIYIRNTPNRVRSIGALSAADKPRPSTMRVSAGSITPSSHKRALA